MNAKDPEQGPEYNVRCSRGQLSLLTPTNHLNSRGHLYLLCLYSIGTCPNSQRSPGAPSSVLQCDRGVGRDGLSRVALKLAQRACSKETSGEGLCSLGL